MSNALDDFVNRDAGAISRLIEQRVKETRALVEERGEALEEDDVEKAVGEAVEQRLARANPTRARAGCRRRRGGRRRKRRRPRRRRRRRRNANERDG